MTWAGDPIFGEGWALFRGDAADNALHAHAAIQVGLAGTGELSLRDAAGVLHSGAAMVVRPLVGHVLITSGVVTLLYIEPQSALAARFFSRPETRGIFPIDLRAAIGLAPNAPITAWRSRLEAVASTPHDALDVRLQTALQRLQDTPGALTIASAAALCGLSESRLRTLAREKLGLPISTWLIWRKLERATRAMVEGESLAAAAALGGFADQAHLARVMRRMFGVTPRTAQRAIGAVSR